MSDFEAAFSITFGMLSGAFSFVVLAGFVILSAMALGKLIGMMIEYSGKRKEQSDDRT